MQTTGYIAGATNPYFEEQPHTWDILCDINTGKVTVAEDLGKKTLGAMFSQAAFGKHRYDSYDTEFINKVIKGIDLNCGEFWIRRKFMNYSQLIVDMAFHGSEFNSKSSSTLVKIKDANTSRISDWKDTSSYLFAANVEDMMDKRRVVTGMDVGKHVRLLHTAMQGWRTLTIENVNKIFTHFVKYVRSNEQLLELHHYLTLYGVDVEDIALRQYKCSEPVRMALMALLSRIEAAKRDMFDQLGLQEV
eukprot:TRINITY_DN916_c0_g2_i3.p1 TRINITY_DN916_c0_g2~~TRINITY_DN916_c0_g2_i3.p1  ORF type:complete len:247 (-),score=85.45 TRINITY_DN916_c0_g2_i3:310-1050(-)